MNIKQLEDRLTKLEQEKNALLVEGETIYGGWIDSLTKNGKIYRRLRWHRGNGLTPGCRTLKSNEVEEIERSIQRGKRITAIESEMNVLGKELDQKRDLVRQLIG